MESQEDLIGQEKERAGDESRQAKMHQQWLEQQDAQQVAHLMAGLRNGFRRKRAGDLLDEDVSTCFQQSLTAFTHITAVESYCTHSYSIVPGVPENCNGCLLCMQRVPQVCGRPTVSKDLFVWACLSMSVATAVHLGHVARCEMQLWYAPGGYRP